MKSKFSEHFRLVVLLLALALTLLATADFALAASGKGTPAVLDFQLDSLDKVPVLRTPAIDPQALITEDAERDGPDSPTRFALSRRVSVTCDDSGHWEEPTALHRVWRLRILAPGALSVNLGFSVFDLPAGGQLSMYPTALTGPDDERGVRVFPAGDQDQLGQLWTPVVLGDDIMIEVLVPTGSSSWRLQLEAVNQGYRFFGEDPADKAGSCNIDVVCPEGDPWRAEINAVGNYTISGVFKCTGSLINNTRQDGKPLFLTAYHCSPDMATYANTVVVYWNFQSPVCGQHGGGSQDDFSTGAIFRSSYLTSDFNLIELEDPLDPAFGCTLAGWDRRDIAPPSAVTIHHPHSDEKSISFENDPLSVTTYLENDVPGDGTHLRITDWDLGTTEPGSSGSPLFNPDHRIVGQLHGGFAACVNDKSDWYGRLFRSWEGGGTPESRLRDWLDPDGTGVEYLNLLDPGQPEQAVTPLTALSFTAPQGGDFTPASGSYFLDNNGVLALDFQIEGDQPWLDISPASGVLEPGVQIEVVITPRSDVSRLEVGRHTMSVTFHNLTNGLGDATRPVILEIQSVTPGISTPVPNPFVDYTVVNYVLPVAGPVTARILDVRGRCVRVFGSLAGVLGPNQLAWDGKDDQRRAVPAGLYFLRLESGGVTLQTRITRTR